MHPSKCSQYDASYFLILRRSVDAVIFLFNVTTTFGPVARVVSTSWIWRIPFDETNVEIQLFRLAPIHVDKSCDKYYICWLWFSGLWRRLCVFVINIIYVDYGFLGCDAVCVCVCVCVCVRARASARLTKFWRKVSPPETSQPRRILSISSAPL
jgi:hypothetical protein